MTEPTSSIPQNVTESSDEAGDTTTAPSTHPCLPTLSVEQQSAEPGQAQDVTDTDTVSTDIQQSTVSTEPSEQQFTSTQPSPTRLRRYEPTYSGASADVVIIVSSDDDSETEPVHQSHQQVNINSELFTFSEYSSVSIKNCKLMRLVLLSRNRLGADAKQLQVSACSRTFDGFWGKKKDFAVGNHSAEIKTCKVTSRYDLVVKYIVFKIAVSEFVSKALKIN